jgi:hypothetical protein
VCASAVTDWSAHRVKAASLRQPLAIDKERGPRSLIEIRASIANFKSGMQGSFPAFTRCLMAAFIHAFSLCLTLSVLLPPRLNAADELEQDLTARLRDLGVQVFTHPRTRRVVEINANQNTRLENDHLRWIANFTELTDLSLEATQITDQGIAHLAKLRKLEWLNLYRTKVGDESLRVLSEMKSLRHLPIGETRVTDQGLAHLEKMDQLVYLGLRGNKITDEGLRSLATLTNLTGLNLAETAISDVGLGQLRNLTALQQLWLQTTSITDRSVSVLIGFRELEKLEVTKTKLTAKGLEHLRADLPRCQTIFSAPVEEKK